MSRVIHQPVPGFEPTTSHSWVSNYLPLTIRRGRDPLTKLSIMLILSILAGKMNRQLDNAKTLEWSVILCWNFSLEDRAHGSIPYSHYLWNWIERIILCGWGGTRWHVADTEIDLKSARVGSLICCQAAWDQYCKTYFAITKQHYLRHKMNLYLSRNCNIKNEKVL